MLYKTKFRTEYDAIVGVLMVASIAVILYVLLNFITDPYWNFSLLIFLILGSSVLLITAREIKLKTQINLAENNIVFMDRKGKILETVAYNDITQIGETLGAPAETILVVKSAMSTNYIYGYKYSNFIELKRRIIESTGLELVKGLEKEKTHFVSAVLVVATLLIFPLVWNGVIDNTHTKGELATIKYMHNGVPLHEDDSPEHTGQIIISVHQYPDFRFRIAGEDFDKMRVLSYWQVVKTGDSLEMAVDKVDFETKLAKTREPSFWIKHNGYSTIKVLDLRKGNDIYLDYEKHFYDEPIVRGASRFRAILFIGVLLILGLAILYKRLNANM